jgi:hypothetical protein
MTATTRRETVDLAAYPDLIVVLLGFHIRRLRSLPALAGIGRGLAAIAREPPDGLLRDERCLYAWNHLGIRQYWRDPDSLEAFTTAEPHATWWRDFLRDPRGSGFWHEVYSARGGVEAVYVNMPRRPGLGAFAPVRQPVGPFLSGRDRLRADAQARSAAAP